MEMQVSAQEYEASTTDPVAAFTAPIASHMNADHADSIIAMLKHYASIPVQQAKITGLDRCGIASWCWLSDVHVDAIAVPLTTRNG